MRAGVNPEQIGIVTPYEGQRAHIVQHLEGRRPVRVVEGLVCVRAPQDTRVR